LCVAARVVDGAWAGVKSPGAGVGLGFRVVGIGDLICTTSQACKMSWVAEQASFCSGPTTPTRVSLLVLESAAAASAVGNRVALGAAVAGGGSGGGVTAGAAPSLAQARPQLVESFAAAHPIRHCAHSGLLPMSPITAEVLSADDPTCTTSAIVHADEAARRPASGAAVAGSLEGGAAPASDTALQHAPMFARARACVRVCVCVRAHMHM
jgi:hypothetical protein